jgi:hypothetical protein
MNDKNKIDPCDMDVWLNLESNIKIQKPISITFNPKDDITAFELAQCILAMNSIFYGVPDEPYMRHFDAYDPNK